MWIKSFKLILRQNRFTYFILVAIGIFGVFAVYLSNPGEEGLQAYLEIEESPFGQIFFGALLEEIGSENSAFYLYFVFLYFMAYLANTFPIVGLWLGGSGIPEEINSNMADIFIASSQKKEKLVFRHLITHGTIFTVLTAVLYLTVPILYELLSTTINYERVFLAYILLWISGLTFFSISFFFSISTLRSEIGRGIAGIIFLLSFLVQMIYNLNPVLKDLKFFNILYYTNSNSILLKGDNLKAENFLPLLLIGILIFFGILIFINRDPLSLQIWQKSNSNHDEKSGKGRKTQSFFNKIALKDYVNGFLQKISPISAEQWKADRILVVFFFCFCFFAVVSIIAGYPTGEGGIEQFSGIYTNNPFVKSIQRGYGDSIINDPLYTIYTQFYGYTWIYLFPLVIITAGRIIERDIDNKTIDLILSTPVKPKRIIFARIITSLLEIFCFTTMVVLLLIIGEFALNINSKVLEQLISIFFIFFTYGTLLFFLIAIGIAFPVPKYRKRVIYGVSGITIILAVLPYFNEVLLPLKYFSLLYYLDLIGLISLGYQIEQLSLLLVLIAVLIVSFTFVSFQTNKMELV